MPTRAYVTRHPITRAEAAKVIRLFDTTDLSAALIGKRMGMPMTAVYAILHGRKFDGLRSVRSDGSKFVLQVSE